MNTDITLLPCGCDTSDTSMCIRYLLQFSPVGWKLLPLSFVRLGNRGKSGAGISHTLPTVVYTTMTARLRSPIEYILSPDLHRRGCTLNVTMLFANHGGMKGSQWWMRWSYCDIAMRSAVLLHQLRQIRHLVYRRPPSPDAGGFQTPVLFGLSTDWTILQRRTNEPSCVIHTQTSISIECVNMVDIPYDAPTTLYRPACLHCAWRFPERIEQTMAVRAYEV